MFIIIVSDTALVQLVNQIHTVLRIGSTDSLFHYPVSTGFTFLT